MANLISRVEFRAILKRIVGCLRESLPVTVSPLTPEEIHFWLSEITLEDIRIVTAVDDSEHRDKSEERLDTNANKR